MTIRWKELIAPGIMLLAILFYWVQVRGQARAVVLIPYGVIVLLLVLIALVIWEQALIKGKRKGKDHPKEIKIRSPEVQGMKERLGKWLLAYKREFIFILLSIGYYFAFIHLGFTLANILFLILAFLTTGLKWKPLFWCTVITVVIFYMTSSLMQLDAPELPWFLR
jgi:hypothetical protein